MEQSKELKEQYYRELCEFLASINNAQDMDMLLQDLCTYGEVDQMAQRLKSAKMLLEGKTYGQVIESTEISSATLSRVSRCIQHGSGGYAELVKRYMQEQK